MAQRLKLTAEERIQKSQSIAEHYLKLFQKECPKVLHLFLSMPAKAEVDTRFILERINTEYPDVKTLTSVMAHDQVSLLTVEVRMDTLLAYNQWGIPEPIRRISFPEQEIEEVLTPLLAMDTAGNRLGYGKGFYDRFFDSCTPAVKRTGLNFFSATTQELAKDLWDVPLHRLVTPEGIVEVHSNT